VIAGGALVAMRLANYVCRQRIANSTRAILVSSIKGHYISHTCQSIIQQTRWAEPAETMKQAGNKEGEAGQGGGEGQTDRKDALDGHEDGGQEDRLLKA
jgi:methylmalonyl-CoA mutase cobalamin-binding subunit